jgi:hypothetical protein
VFSLPPSLYCAENVRRAKYAQVVVAVLTLVLCGFMGIQCGIAMSRVSRAEQLLRKSKADAANLSRELSRQRETEARTALPSVDSLESFAVRFDEWARRERVRVDSFVPEGAPVASEIVVEGARLGLWSAFKVRVKGSGEYESVLRLLDNFRRPEVPAKLDSFALQAASGLSKTVINFDLLLTVYERKKSSN